MADHDGHFVVSFVPSGVPVGAYRIQARASTGEAVAPLEIAGPPVVGEAGQLPGQDEARAGAQPLDGPVDTDGLLANPVTEGPTSAPADLGRTTLVVASVVGVALAFGIIVGRRTHSPDRS